MNTVKKLSLHDKWLMFIHFFGLLIVFFAILNLNDVTKVFNPQVAIPFLILGSLNAVQSLMSILKLYECKLRSIVFFILWFFGLVFTSIKYDFNIWFFSIFLLFSINYLLEIVGLKTVGLKTQD